MTEVPLNLKILTNLPYKNDCTLIGYEYPVDRHMKSAPPKLAIKTGSTVTRVLLHVIWLGESPQPRFFKSSSSHKFDHPTRVKI